MIEPGWSVWLNVGRWHLELSKVGLHRERTDYFVIGFGFTPTG